MYNFRYQYILASGSTQDSDYKNETILTAKFSFDDQVAPKDRADVRRRCNLFPAPESYHDQSLGKLDSFITDKLGYRPEARDPLRGKSYSGKREVVKITPFLWGLGFRLRSEARGQLEMNRMINLRALEEFVLTGELSPQTVEELQFSNQNIGTNKIA